MVNVLLAGDLFVTPDVLAEALERHLPGATTTRLQGTWPDDAMIEIGGVHEAVGDEDELIEALKGVEVCFTHSHPITRKVIAASPDLKLITVCRGGPVNADKAAASDHGVALSYTPGRNATATTEHSVGMILSAARQIAQRHHELVSGEWRGDYYRYELVGPELHGATVGLVGYGAIGSRVAGILKAMGMRVRVYDPYLREPLPDGYEHVADLDDLLASANVLTIHARQTDENRGLIGAREIGLMPA
ncbi:MAG: NAD(P)-dependent oxidoreductase, partial [Brooklawnia sp.]